MMNKLIYFVVLAVAMFFVAGLNIKQKMLPEFSSAYAAQKKEVQVKGHMTKDGTYVKPHKRTVKKKKK